MDEIMKIEGIVDDIIFYNSENGYAIFKVIISEDNPDLSGEDLICVGYTPGIAEGESVKVAGQMVLHPTYGEQLRVDVFEKTVPKSVFAIEKYLASGVIKGVGPKIARKIVDKFGKDTLAVIESTPEKLSKIKGISVEKALNIGAVYKEQSELREVMLFLQEYNISSAYALKIYKKYKERTVFVIQNNPYLLADEVYGIGFKTADSIAKSVGFEMNSPFRVKAGIKYVLNSAVSNGHTYLPLEMLIEQTIKLLEIDINDITSLIRKMHIENQIWYEVDDNGESRVYLNSLYYAECYVAQKLLRLSGMSIGTISDYNRKIDVLEQEQGITLASEQRLAINEAMNSGAMVITGGPGTGKTTIINAIISLYMNEGYVIELAAPTGRAAKRMTEATGMEAQTIHRLLGMSFESEGGGKNIEKNEENPIEADVVIIDESSMVDVMLMNYLLKAVCVGTRLILVGDANQLPSVGPGNVLKNIISSECIKVVKLTEIFRQAQESAIVMNAHKINRGEYPDISEKDKDFFFMKRENIDAVSATLLELVTKRLPRYLGCDALRDIQVLTPMRKSPLGVESLNKVLQNCLNPKSRDKKEKEFRGSVFREGDKVMQIKNNYELEWEIVEGGLRISKGVGVFNGDEGIIAYIDEENEYVEVVYEDNKYARYDFSQLEELELSYAVTIHKSQGSEYKAVVMPVHSGPPMLLNRNLLYTALTRAKNLAVMVGIPETLYRMVDNNKEIDRYTCLTERIKELSEI